MVKQEKEDRELEYISQIVKDMKIGSNRNSKESSFDGEAWRAAADQSID